MRKAYYAAFLLLVLAVTAAFAQTAKPRLGILPFTGGTGGDGETIATLFAMQNDIMAAFTVVPRTSAVNALVAEQNFQMSGYTDSDTIARLGRLLNADFVISGHIRRLGDRNLVITTVVNVETFEQIAGDYREYQNIEEVPSLLPGISRIIITGSRRNTSRLPKLAVAPFNIANQDINVQDAEILAQILAVEIVNAGQYAVLPRTTAIQAAMKELELQASGATVEEEAKALGRAINAQYVLNAEVRSLGTNNLFTAQILHVEDGSLQAGNYRYYRTISDGIILMKELAGLLSGADGTAAPPPPPPPPPMPVPVPPPRPRPERPVKERKVITPEEVRAARLWTLGISVGTALAPPWVIATVHTTLAPIRYSFFEFGIDFGFRSGEEDVVYYSLYPFAHFALFFPFARKGGWYMGGGAGYMMANYTFPKGEISQNIFAIDMITGFNLGNVFDISYTLRADMNFTRASSKFSMGLVKRF